MSRGQKLSRGFAVFDRNSDVALGGLQLIIFKNSIGTSQKTCCVFNAETSQLIMF
jgi:hypothetical protein